LNLKAMTAAILAISMAIAAIYPLNYLIQSMSSATLNSAIPFSLMDSVMIVSAIIFYSINSVRHLILTSLL